MRHAFLAMTGAFLLCAAMGCEQKPADAPVTPPMPPAGTDAASPSGTGATTDDDRAGVNVQADDGGVNVEVKGRDRNANDPSADVPGDGK